MAILSGVGTIPTGKIPGQDPAPGFSIGAWVTKRVSPRTPFSRDLRRKVSQRTCGLWYVSGFRNSTSMTATAWLPGRRQTHSFCVRGRNSRKMYREKKTAKPVISPGKRPSYIFSGRSGTG